MAHLPSVTWHEVATKGDLRSQTAILRSGTEAVGTELRSEMTAMRTELRGEMTAMGTELRSEMQEMCADLRTEFVDGTNRQITWLVGFAVVWSSLLVTLVALIS